MKISIITVSYNAAPYIRTCIDSVLSQDYSDIEYIVIDGNSTDGTQEIVKSYGDNIDIFTSEPDKGIYDAMNKGLALATGDVIGILNADDLYAHKSILSQVVKQMNKTQADTLYGDLSFVSVDNLEKVVRFYSGGSFKPHKMKQGNMPPHPTYFVKKRIYDEFGNFDTTYKICADFDIMVRFFLVHQVSYTYLPETMVKMRAGGVSTQGIKSNLTINKEMLSACKKYGISTNLVKIYSKYFTKVFQLVKKK